MAIVDNLEKLKDYLQAVCDQVKLKMPDEYQDGNYKYTLVSPSVFVLYTPTKDRLPPNIKAPVPSICIKFNEGEHLESINTMSVVLNFCTWNPGLHQKDVFVPTDKIADIKEYNQSAELEFKRTADGWQDVLNFVDVILRNLEKAEYIADMRIDTSQGIKYGMSTDSDGLDDFYPYWLAWISFTLQCGNVRNKTFDNLL